MLQGENSGLTSGGSSFGPYRLEGEIGYGGMGAVYRAQDTHTGRAVAIKLLPPEYLNDLGLRAGFEREGQLIASFDHEAIVPVYEIGELDGQPFIAMQYMTNGSLADRLLRGALGPIETVPILDRICQAIDYAHEHGVIHRDLKPSNILFDQDDLAYLADFGIAWQSNYPAGVHPAGAPISGTPAYLSPEQALGELEIGASSDIYSLGIILFETLTGLVPFSGETPLAVILQQVHDQPPSLRAVDPGLPNTLDEVIQRSLAKDPSERFSTAGELNRAFQAALAEENAGQTALQTPADSPTAAGEDFHSPVGPSQPAASLEGPVAGDSAGADLSKSEAIEKVPQETPLLHPVESVQSTALQASPVSPSPVRGSWRSAHFISLAFATLFGVVLAAGLAAFLQVRGAATPTGVQLTFDSQALVLTNNTGAPLDLTGIVFRRVEAEGSKTVEFRASNWMELPGNPSPELQPGACYELLRPGADSSGGSTTADLGKRKILLAPRSCRELQAWLVAQGPESLFWVLLISPPDASSPDVSHSATGVTATDNPQARVQATGGAAFHVFLNGRLIQTCPLDAGECLFSLQPAGEK